MNSATSRSKSIGRAMFREIAQARLDRACVGALLLAYLTGPSGTEVADFLAAYLCRTMAGFIPDPEHLDP